MKWFKKKKEKIVEMMKEFNALALVECKCTRWINGELKTIHCYIKEGTTPKCVNMTDLEFEKSLEEDK